MLGIRVTMLLPIWRRASDIQPADRRLSLLYSIVLPYAHVAQRHLQVGAFGVSLGSLYRRVNDAGLLRGFDDFT